MMSFAEGLPALAGLAPPAASDPENLGNVLTTDLEGYSPSVVERLSAVLSASHTRNLFHDFSIN
jgi:hypothetical protein